MSGRRGASVELVISSANGSIYTPWTVEALDGGFKIVDANGQALAYAYGHADPRDAPPDEARRIASNIAKLPHLLGKD